MSYLSITLYLSLSSHTHTHTQPLCHSRGWGCHDKGIISLWLFLPDLPPSMPVFSLSLSLSLFLSSQKHTHNFYITLGDGDVMMRVLPSLLAVEYMRAGSTPLHAAQQVQLYYRTKQDGFPHKTHSYSTSKCFFIGDH